jgi:hypothetical protein
MEIQQMLERLLAGQEQMKQEMMAEMGAKIDPNQAKAEAKRKADKE